MGYYFLCFAPALLLCCEMAVAPAKQGNRMLVIPGVDELHEMLKKNQSRY